MNTIKTIMTTMLITTLAACSTEPTASSVTDAPPHNPNTIDLYGEDAAQIISVLEEINIVPAVDQGEAQKYFFLLCQNEFRQTQRQYTEFCIPLASVAYEAENVQF